MTDLVNPLDIERIVGTPRHPEDHYGRAVSAEQQFYILHSARCLSTCRDLRDCPFSLALDRGIDLVMWRYAVDRPVRLRFGILDDLLPDGPPPSEPP